MTLADLESLPIIGEPTVASLLEWPALIDSQQHAMTEFSAGRVAQPVRQIVPVPGEDGFIAAMPAVGSAMAVKIVTLYHSNAGTDVPTHQGVIMVFDKQSGSPLALMDGRLITEMRGAAASAAAARVLASPASDVVTIMGSGIQARAHAEAFAAVTDWTELRLWARRPEAGRLMAAEIIACTTAATEPILHGAWLKPGAFVTAVGWNPPDGRELDDDAMANIVIVESRDAALDQAGNVRGSGCQIFAEIGEVYSGAVAVPAGATVIYDSVGMAIMDVAAAQLVYDAWLANR